jgi:hypothetical protein
MGLIAELDAPAQRHLWLQDLGGSDLLAVALHVQVTKVLIARIEIYMLAESYLPDAQCDGTPGIVDDARLPIG